MRAHTHTHTYIYIYIYIVQLDEKIGIINFKDRRQLLNGRNELVFKCRHEDKFRLS